MALPIYTLCALTALACCVLLLLGARRTGSRMLFWSGLCFGLLTIANLLIVVDHYVLPDVDLWPLRLGAGLVAIALLLYGLIFEEK